MSQIPGKFPILPEIAISEPWILNLIAHQIEVRRNPVASESQPFGFGYSEMIILTEDQHVSPRKASARNGYL